jgi:hypothetical protein
MDSPALYISTPWRSGQQGDPGDRVRWPQRQTELCPAAAGTVTCGRRNFTQRQAELYPSAAGTVTCGRRNFTQRQAELYPSAAGTVTCGRRNFTQQQAELYPAAAGTLTCVRRSFTQRQVELYPAADRTYTSGRRNLYQRKVELILAEVYQRNAEITHRQAEPNPTAGETFPSDMLNFANGPSSRAVLLPLEDPRTPAYMLYNINLCFVLCKQFTNEMQ